MRRLTAALGVSILLAPTLPATPSLAAGDFVPGFILGLGSGAILRDVTKNNSASTKRRTNYDPGAAARRDRMRAIQTSLNDLGYDAGPADGLSGPRTRSAIAAFQADMGMAPTGNLTEQQLVILYQQAGAGGGYATPSAPAYGTGYAPATQGAVAPAAPAQFPSLGNPAATNGVAPQAFPSVGTTPAAAAPSGQFPALGAPADGQAATGEGFPALSAPAATASTQQTDGTFPALATPAPDADTAASAGFPSLAPATKTQGTSEAFPTLATTPEPEPVQSKAFPSLAEAPAADATPLTLAGEIGKTPFGTLENQPAILGFGLASQPDAVTEILAQNGFEDCAPETLDLFECERQTDTLNDKVRVWSSKEGGVWSVSRTISFPEPVPADFIATQFAKTYPQIMAASTRTISSAPDCTFSGHSPYEVAALLDAYASADENVGPADDLMAVAANCPLAYSISLAETEQGVSAVKALFFDGTGLLRLKAGAEQARQEELASDLVF